MKDPNSNPEEIQRQKIEFAWKAFENSRSFSHHLDFKYAAILGVSTAAIGLLGAILKDRTDDFQTLGVVSIFSVLSILSFFIAIIYIVVSNSPSLTAKDQGLKFTGEDLKDELPRSSLFFSDIERTGSADRYRELLDARYSREEELRDLTDQIYEISVITSRKSRRIRSSTIAMLIGLTSSFVVFIAILLSGTPK